MPQTVVLQSPSHWTWTPPTDGSTAAEIDANTESIREAIQQVIASGSPDVDAGGVPILEIVSTIPGQTIKVRPNIAPDIPDSFSTERLQGLTIQGGGSRSTIFEVVYDGTPSSAYYFYDPTVYTATSTVKIGRYARTWFRDLAVVPEGGGPNVDLQDVYPATISDDGSNPKWEYFRGFRLLNWSKEPTFFNCYFQGMRVAIEAGYGTDPTSTSYVNADTGSFQRVTFNACGTILWLRHIQAMAWDFRDCEISYLRRHGFHIQAGGDIHFDGKFVSMDENVVPASYSSLPYVPDWWLFYVEPDCASSIQNGGYYYRAKTELRGSHGLFKSVPTNSGDYGSDPGDSDYLDYISAGNDEKRERLCKIYDCTISTMANPNSPLGDSNGRRGGVPRVVVQCGINQRFECVDASIGQNISGNIQSSDRDSPVFQAVVSDKAYADGGTASKYSASMIPSLHFIRSFIPRNLKRDFIETVRPDGTPGTGAMVDVKIVDPIYFDESTGDVFTYRRERYAEDGHWLGSGGNMARAGDTVTVDLVSGLDSIPGNKPGVIERLYLPAPVELVAVETWLDALGSGAADASWRVVDKDGNVYGATPTQDAYLEHYAKETFPRTGESPVFFESREDWLDFTCSTAGTVANSMRRSYCRVTYRPIRPHYNGGTANSYPDPYRTTGPYSRHLAIRLAHNWTLDEQDTAAGIYDSGGTAITTEDATDYGFTVVPITLSAAGTTPTNTLDGTLGRYVKVFSSAGRLENTSANFVDFSLTEDFTVFALVYFSDNDSSFSFVYKFVANSDNELSFGSKTDGSNSKLRIRARVGGSYTVDSSVDATSGTWIPTMFRKNSAGWELYLGGASSVASGGDIGWASGMDVTGAGIGGYAGAGLFAGRISNVAVAVNHYASDADYTIWRTSLQPFTKSP